MNKQGLIELSSHEAYMRWSQINLLNTKDFSDWIKDCNNCKRFAEGGENQWTEEELESLKSRGNYTMTMDMTRKAIQSIVGVITANKPSIKCIPANDKKTPHAKIRNMLIDQAWRDSDGLLRVRDIAANAYTCNICYAFVMPLDNRVQFRKLEYDQVLVEPSSTDPMFRDAEYICIRKWLPIEKVKAMYGLESINTTMPTEFGLADFHRTANTFKMFDYSRRYMQIFEIYRKVPYRDKNNDFKTQIVREILLGFQYLFRDVLPPEITEYPVVPLYSGLSSNPYKYSEMHYMREPQRFINKMYNVTIANAQATGTPKMVVRTTDIPNENIEDFTNKYAIPGNIVEINPGAEAPMVIAAQPLSQAYFTLYQDATQHLFRIYSSLGLDGAAIDSSQNNNAVSLYEKREAVMDSLRMLAGIWEAFLKQLGKVILEHYSAYVDKDELTKIVNGNDAIKKVEQDLQNGLDLKSPENTQKWMEAMKKKGIPDQEISAHLDEAQERSDFVDALFDILVDIDDLKYDIEIVQDSYAPSYQASQFNIALQLSQNGVLDPSSLLELAPIDDKEKLIKRNDALKQQSQQLQAMQEELEKTQQELEKREKQIKDMLIKSEVDNAKVKQEYLYKDARVKESDKARKAALSQKAAMDNLDIQIEKFLLSLEKNKEEISKLTAQDIRSNIII